MSSISCRVPCPFCRAPEAAECVTRTGRLARYSHFERWTALQHATRHRVSRMELLIDDTERFGLQAGDVLLCVPYPYDSKWTVLRRESDGYDPECNQYASDMRWLGWAS